MGPIIQTPGYVKLNAALRSMLTANEITPQQEQANAAAIAHVNKLLTQVKGLFPGATATNFGSTRSCGCVQSFLK